MTCPVDAKSDANESSNGVEAQPSGSPPSLIEAISELVQELRLGNHLLLELVGQNEILIGSLIDHEELDDEPTVDMEGNPIRAS